MNAQQGDGEALSTAECLALLSTTNVGRIAYSERALPAIAAVTFAVVDGFVVLRADGRSQVGASLRNTVVAFQADHQGVAGAQGWSVTCVGQSRPVLDADEADLLAGLPVWPDPAVGRPEFFRIETETLTCSRSYGSPGMVGAVSS